MKTLVDGRAWGFGILLVTAAVAGCSAFKSPQAPVDSSAGLFDSAQLRYEVDTDRINGRVGSTEEKLVSYHQAVSSHLPANSRASIEVRYPHPDEREGYAQVQVRIENHGGDKPAAAPAWKRWWLVTRESLPGFKDADGTHEIWTLDIPKSELALLINRLDSSGYFGSYEKAEGTKIQTDLDGSKVVKSWHQIPEIDALVIRVRTEGRLTSSSKALANPLASKEPSASVAIYRSLLAGDEPSDLERAPSDGGMALASDQVNDSHVVPVNHVEIVRLPAVGGGLR